MEYLIVLGIVLFFNGWFQWASQKRGLRLLREELASDLKNNTRSVKDSVKSSVAKAIQPKVDVGLMIEDIIQQLSAQQAVETHSNMEYEIVKYVAAERFGADCVDERPQYIANKNRGFDLKSTLISIR